MARQESDREDILREATALIDRVELQCDGWVEPVVFGLRRQGAMSIFIGQDEVYQFDSHQALRRAFWHGQLLKAERGRLVQLTRERSPRQTVLRRRELTEQEQAEHLRRLERRIAGLCRVLEHGLYRVQGEVSGSGGSVVQRVLQWLDQFPSTAAVASNARVG
jgi:hypothetical protein